MVNCCTFNQSTSVQIATPPNRHRSATTPRSATRWVTSPAASGMTRIIRSEATFLRSGWLAAFFLLVVLLTWMRTLAVCCPVIFGDEALYSLLSKFTWREHAAQHNELVIDLPNYLYFRL